MVLVAIILLAPVRIVKPVKIKNLDFGEKVVIAFFIMLLLLATFGCHPAYACSDESDKISPVVTMWSQSL